MCDASADVGSESYADSRRRREDKLLKMTPEEKTKFLQSEEKGERNFMFIAMGVMACVLVGVIAKPSAKAHTSSVSVQQCIEQIHKDNVKNNGDKNKPLKVNEGMCTTYLKYNILPQTGLNSYNPTLQTKIEQIRARASHLSPEQTLKFKL